MASPQKENGYTAISNELFESIINRDFTIGEQTILLFIIRKTYGFQKKIDRISLSQFEKLGFNRGNVCKILNRLTAMFVIKRDSGKYGINKNYDDWVVSHRILAKKASASIAQETQLVSHRIHTKETITKENIIAKAIEGKLSTKKKPMYTYEAVDDDCNEGSFSPRGKFKIKKTSEFIWENEIEKMKNSPIKIHQTILLYWLIKKWKFENWEQFDSALKRELRPAKALNGYTLTEVRKAIAYCRKKFEDNWTLETIGKWIPEALKANSL